MTSEKTKTSNLKKDSAPLDLEVVRCSLAGTVVRSAMRAYNGCTSSNELGAQYVQPHQRTIKRKKRRHLESMCLPLLLRIASNAWTSMKNKVSGCSERHHCCRNAFHKGSQGTAGPAGLRKMVQKRKANCFALLRWITKLKCVNSEVKSVLCHPQRGCLQWLHGTISEPPWI